MDIESPPPVKKRGRPIGRKAKLLKEAKGRNPLREAAGKKKAVLLKDTIVRMESYKDALQREITGDETLALSLDDETSEAHNLYLYGRRGNKPIRDVDKLSELSGVPKHHLRILIPAWRQEAIRMAREASPFFALASTAKARAAHQKDLEVMRRKIEEFEAELPDVTAKDFPCKYKFLMEMRREWQDAAGITAAINISQAMTIAEGKHLLETKKPEEGGEDEDLSAFDVDV